MPTTEPREVDWSRLTAADWTRLVAAMLERHDLEHIPGVLAAMAVHGYPSEAEDLRLTMLAAAALGGDRG